MDFNHFVLMLAIAFGFGIFGYVIGAQERERQAIERGFAIHCPLNGKFGWIDECKEELDIP